jgi:23S rRNA (uracil1939-C5)-methyltransferase
LTPIQERKPARGDLLEVTLDRIDERGRTLGASGEYTVAVRGGIAGARVVARVEKRRRNGIEAVQERELAPSRDAVTPRCRHVASCGGCSFQALDYPAQLGAKRALLAQLLAPLSVADVPAVLACGEPWNYRNKMDFSFGRARWIEAGEPLDAPRDFALGLHARGHYQKVLDIQACEIAFAGAAAIVNTVRELARAHGLAPWDVRTHAGLLRHLVLRRSWATGEILADLVTSAAAPETLAPLAAEILARHPELTTLVQHVNERPATIAVGELAAVFKGNGRIEERLDGLVYSISAESFFQTNTPQAEVLARLVRDWSAVAPGETLFDLYCGCGSFALSLARALGPERVVGFELVEAAIVDARANAARNGLDGVRFVAGDLAATLTPEALALRGLARPTVCVVDPPRAGMHPKVRESLALLEPERIVYVSCNPRTGALDLAFLLARGYVLRAVQPVDLFPHTPHVECVFRLERITSA